MSTFITMFPFTTFKLFVKDKHQTAAFKPELRCQPSASCLIFVALSRLFDWGNNWPHEPSVHSPKSASTTLRKKRLRMHPIPPKKFLLHILSRGLLTQTDPPQRTRLFPTSDWECLSPKGIGLRQAITQVGHQRKQGRGK